MKLSQLQKKYPKAFNKWIKPELIKADKKYGFGGYKLNLNNADVRGAWKEITDFMDGQGIYIYVTVNNQTKDLWISRIDYSNNSTNIYSEIFYKTRKQAETQAICKAFEILEGRL